MNDITDNMRQYFEPDGAPKQFICGPGTPTPQSDQAEQLANKIVTAFEGHFREWMMPGEHAEAVEVTKEVIEEFLRAQSAELLALRALLTKFQKIAHESRTSEEAMDALFDLSEEVDAALNSPTQKSPAK